MTSHADGLQCAIRWQKVVSGIGLAIEGHEEMLAYYKHTGQTENATQCLNMINTLRNIQVVSAKNIGHWSNFYIEMEKIWKGQAG